MLIECLASRSQIKHRYGSHRQQPQNDNRSDVLDPFLIVREPSMMHVHGQPPPATMLPRSQYIITSYGWFDDGAAHGGVLCSRLAASPTSQVGTWRWEPLA